MKQLSNALTKEVQRLLSEMVLEVKPDTLRKVNMIRRTKVALRKLGKVKDYERKD